MLKDENNQLEKIWRTRILFENTPRGNIVMYYDPYKLGFSYHADTYMPYDILNATAMKYVLTFNCREFFIDELIRPKNKPSPLLKLLEEDKKKSEEEKDDKDIDKEVDSITKTIKNSPFAKFKSYNKISSKISGIKDLKENDNNTTNNESSSEPAKQKERNRFINLGKVTNFQMIQRPEKKIKGFQSTTHSDLFENNSAQKNVFNYKDFKKMRENNDKK